MHKIYEQIFVSFRQNKKRYARSKHETHSPLVHENYLLKVMNWLFVLRWLESETLNFDLGFTPSLSVSVIACCSVSFICLLMNASILVLIFRSTVCVWKFTQTWCCCASLFCSFLFVSTSSPILIQFKYIVYINGQIGTWSLFFGYLIWLFVFVLCSSLFLNVSLSLSLSHSLNHSFTRSIRFQNRQCLWHFVCQLFSMYFFLVLSLLKFL